MLVVRLQLRRNVAPDNVPGSVTPAEYQEVSPTEAQSDMNGSWTPSLRRAPTNVSPLMVLDPSRGLVRSFANNPPYYDEPKLYCIAALLDLPMRIQLHAEQVAPDLGLGHAGGASLDKERAMWKVAGEAAERYSLLVDDAKPILSDFHSLGQSGAVDPNSIVAGTDRKIADRRSTKIYWLSGSALADGSDRWIPYQLIAVPHLFVDEETVWRAPITTGAAAAFSAEEALYEGLCEVIERDAFMISWLRQLQLARVARLPESGKDPLVSLLARTVASTLRYKLRPEFYVLPTGLPVSCIMCLLWDDTGLGPPDTIGTKASWNISLSMLGALEEALQERPWIRRIHARRSTVTRENDRRIETLTDRASLWLSKEAGVILQNWVEESSALVASESLYDECKPCSLRDLTLAIESQGATVYAVDLSLYLPDKIRELGIQATKIVIPEYQPLYLIEELTDYSWDRLVSAEERLGTRAAQPSSVPFSFPHPLL